MRHFVVDPVELSEPDFALTGSLHCVDSVCMHFQTLKGAPTFLPWLACFPALTSIVFTGNPPVRFRDSALLKRAKSILTRP
jgi:hypothetical protein